MEAYKEFVLRRFANGDKVDKIINTVKRRYNITLIEVEILKLIEKHSQYVNNIIEKRASYAKRERTINVTQKLIKVIPYLEEMVVQRSLGGVSVSQFYFIVMKENLITMPLSDFKLGLSHIEELSDVIELRDSKIYGRTI